MTTSPIQLQLQTIFGVRSKLESSLDFIDEQTVIYPAGNQFVLGNVETKGQKMFRCPELERVEWILTNSAAAVLAIVSSQLNGEKTVTTISFYDLHTNVGKRKRTFELRDSMMTIVSASFSHDAKHLAILDQTDGSYTLTLWLWQKSRNLASWRSVQGDGISTISQILFHPKDNNLISIIGRQTSRLVRHSEGNLRLQPSSAKLDQYTFKSHAWYDSNRYIAGTTNGRVCILFNGDVQSEIDVIEGREKRSTTVQRSSSIGSSLAKSHGRSSTQSHLNEHADTSRPSGEEVTEISIVNKGFFCLVGGKKLCLYTRIADSWDFSKTREYVLPGSDLSTARSSTIQSSDSQTSSDKQQGRTPELMCKLTISPAEEHILVLSDKQQIYVVSELVKSQSAEPKQINEKISPNDDKNPPALFATEVIPLELVFNSYHQAAIRGVDTAIQKPLFVSGSDDCTIRLWNYENNSIEQMKVFPDPITTIGLHPSGHQMVVGFSSKVSLMNILIDGFFSVKDYPIHAAKSVRFSNGGHLFAVTDSSIIQIISAVHFKVVYRFNHGQMIIDFYWRKNDLGLYCQSVEHLTGWNIATQTRSLHWKSKDQMAEGFAVDRDEKNFYLTFRDGSIRNLFQEQIINEIKLPPGEVASCLTIFPGNGALLCGTERGSIYVIKTPFSSSPSGFLFSYLAHSAKISRISVAFHEALIISSCRDGCLMLWSTQTKVALQNIEWTPVVLQNKGRFLDLCQTIEKLQVEEEEIRNQKEYRLQQLETNYLSEMQRRTTMCENERQHHEIQIDCLITEKNKAREDFEKKWHDLIEKFQTGKERIEKEDHDRMKRELHKEQELIQLSQKMMEDNEFRWRTMQDESANQVRDIQEFFMGKIREEENQLADIRKKNAEKLRLNEIEKTNIEEDNNEEQLKLKVDFQNEQKRLKQQNEKLKKVFRETLETQVDSLLKKQSEQDVVAGKYHKQIEEHRARFQGMKQEVVSLNNEINERTQTLREKDDRINTLEGKNQELQKFQYVLNFKIAELSKVIEPRNAEIARMKNQLEEMANEKDKRQTELTGNRFSNEEKRRRLHALNSHIDEERRKRKEIENLLRRIKNDIHVEFADLHDPKGVREALANLNEKYILNEESQNIYGKDAAAQGVSEERIGQDRQRLYLERSLGDLKHRLSNDLNATKAHRMRVMNENSMLLQELNGIRAELKIVRGRLQDYEVAKQTAESRAINSVDALIQTLHADAGNYQHRQRTNELIKESEKNQREIQRLRQRLVEFELGVNDRQSSMSDVNDQLENVSILKLV